MDKWQFVFAGYGGAFLAVGIYALWVVRRGKRLSQKVPVERRRFLD